jgi:hypothetical protein
LIDKFFDAASKVFWVYDGSVFKTTVEHVAEGGNSRVDYVALVDNKHIGLCEAKSPSVMTNFCELLPLRGIELKWVHGQPFESKMFSKVSTLFSLVTALVFKEKCVGRIVSGSEKVGMALSYLPQLLDCMPSCER